jgi:PKD domain
MGRHGRVLLAVGVVLGTLTVSVAHAQVVSGPHGKRFGVALASWGPRTPATALGPVHATGLGGVNYHGGVVLHSSSPWLYFWDPTGAIPSGSRSLLSQYLGDVSAASGSSANVYPVLRQYSDTSGIADYRQLFTPSQVVNDTLRYPRSGCPAVTGLPTCLTDAQVQAHLTAVLNLAHLPTGSGEDAPIYFVITPPDVNICFDAAGSQCGSNFFCAYHSFFTANGQNVLYALVPFLVWETNPTKGCQTDGTKLYQTPGGEGDHAYQIADNLSHELSETITDPLLNAWFSAVSGNEVGDNCATFGPNNPLAGTSLRAYAPVLGGTSSAGTLFDQMINGDPYYNQTEWSNGDNGCQTQPSPGSLSAAFTPSASSTLRFVPVAFAPTGTSSTRGFSSSTWNFGDASRAVFTRTAPFRVVHAYRKAGSYLVTLTVVDSVGNLASTSHTVVVH